MENDKLYIYERVSSTKALGPGERYTIWLQGCAHNCKGCIAPETHELERGGYYISVEELIDEIRRNKNLRGVTISGGEPFLQAKKLKRLLLEIEKLELDIICYSGYKLEELEKNIVEGSKELLQHIDILVDGKYIEELNTGEYLRGSSNQNIHHLKNTYKSQEEKMNNYKNRGIEISFKSENDIFITGIPPQNWKDDWIKIKESIYKGDKK